MHIVSYYIFQKVEMLHKMIYRISIIENSTTDKMSNIESFGIVLENYILI